MDKVYIVTAGDYSDYHIEAVFKDKQKAEFYCSCHKNCEIEEYDFSDDNSYTFFNYVRVQYKIYSDKRANDDVYFEFNSLTEEDDDFYNENNEYIWCYADYVYIIVNRKLPKIYDEEKIKNKYTKVLYDLSADIRYILSEQGIDSKSSYKDRSTASDNIKEAIKSKFGIEKE